MRIRGRVFVSSCTVLLAGVLLAGCADSRETADKPTKPPSPTPTPVFTSDADALAAATEVYKRYLKLIDEIGHDGGANPDRVAPLVTEEGLDFEKQEAKKFSDAGARAYGYTRVTATKLQSVEQTGVIATVRIYACEDLSEVDVRDETGKSLISAGRADRVEYQAELQGESPSSLVLKENKYWTGGGVCG